MIDTPQEQALVDAFGGTDPNINKLRQLEAFGLIEPTPNGQGRRLTAAGCVVSAVIIQREQMRLGSLKTVELLEQATSLVQRLMPHVSALIPDDLLLEAAAFAASVPDAKPAAAEDSQLTQVADAVQSAAGN